MSESVIEEQLRKGFPVSAFTEGDSMEPLLYEGKTHVVIAPCKEELSVGDLPIFKRRDGVYIIHRIVGKDDEFYYTRGDNCLYGEMVSKDTVLGIVVEIYRKGKHIPVTDKGYLFYVKVWSFLYPLRKLWYKSRPLLHRIGNRVKGTVKHNEEKSE